MNKIRGTYTAVITPFLKDESIDYNAYEKNIIRNLQQGITGFVVCGTTGENPCLTEDEQIELLEKTKSLVPSDYPVVQGTGLNSTKKTIALSQKAEAHGAHALLVVNPYYNQPTQKGLYLHFKAVADNVNIPLIIYNIKGRSGVNLETDTLMKLIAECPNLMGVKEASGDMKQIKEVIQRAPDYFSVLAGDDKLAFDVIKAGGHGLISVLSNLYPKEMADMVDLACRGEFEKAVAIHNMLSPYYPLCFIETNPQPIKYMMFKKGMCEEVYRLPMCPLEPSGKHIIDKIIV